MAPGELAAQSTCAVQCHRGANRELKVKQGAALHEKALTHMHIQCSGERGVPKYVYVVEWGGSVALRHAARTVSAQSVMAPGHFEDEQLFLPF